MRNALAMTCNVAKALALLALARSECKRLAVFPFSNLFGHGERMQQLTIYKGEPRTASCSTQVAITTKRHKVNFNAALQE
eukprot:3942375-Amphidinium_carterae.2